MELKELKQMVVEANKELPRRKLVKYSWGNVSAVDREKGVIVIKPVGVPYEELTEENISVVTMDGKILGESWTPSVDLDIHRAVYEKFSGVNAIVHTHSTYATILAQLRRPLVCFGTTHADYFADDIPCVRELEEREVLDRYEWNTGMSIVDYFKENHISPEDIPAALTPGHGPFTWGKDVWDAVHKSVVLEEISKMAVCMLCIDKNAQPLKRSVADRHYNRKHGADAAFTKDDYGHGMVQRQTDVEMR